MAKPFAELEAKMSPASRARSDALYEQLVAEMPLHELRRAKALSQVKLAEALHINQAAVSKMENRADMYISTLRDYIRAMGGDLEIVARFPDGAVKISNFADHEASPEAAAEAAAR
ncbi:XRE family transcriptional regulator [Pseudoxanthomonas sp. X-1]|uniref:XRE family transcriptional regulator n=1 Tax=Pseudoxanthomonas sp. X-1 TaxID=2571115 RepID=UPI00110B63E3|nr:XRE family transcriptional regulator [Pseudoxanthomonas sp. X-1]TMN24546.1 helix-turn-helix domain-containing protein [Pseudoxanthomonas sp. X-1]UAY75185.1 helix-turn-helix domain-containing protein [Pseudoxanthomonas sp. X-1]